MFKYIESLCSTASTLFKQNLESFIDLETIQDAQTLVTAEGALVSLVKVEGFRGLFGETERASVLETLTYGLSPFLSKRGYALQVFYNRENQIDPEILKKYQAGARRIAEKFGLHLEDLFEAEVETLSQHSVLDEFYMALWTRPTALLKEELSENRKAQYKAPWVVARRSQDPRVCLKDLAFRHESFLKGTLSLLENALIRANCLEVHEALKAIRSALYPGRNYDHWRANLPGDPLRPRVGQEQKEDYSDVLWPSLKSQLCDESPEVVSRNVIKIGERLWGGVDITLAPAEVQPLAGLMKTLERSSVPFRISFFLEGEACSGFPFKKAMATLLSMTNKENRLISQSIESIVSKSSHETFVGLRLSLATWAPDPQLDLLKRRVAILHKSVEGWGDAQATRECGDPLEIFLSSALGISCHGTAPKVAAPLKDVLTMLPFHRVASPFQRGTSVFLTEDGKPWLYDGRSSDMARYIEIVAGSSGSGKSVLVNSLLSKQILSTSSEEMPYVGIIDIGPSSAGAISLMKESLPLKQRPEVGYFRLKMHEDYAINPFDTQLGCRTPLPQEKGFLISFIQTVLSPLDGSDLPDEMNHLIVHVIDEMYRQGNDQENGAHPKRYTPGLDERVDFAIKASSIALLEDPLWWEVVDGLFEKGFVHEALLAQRYAVPTLSDASIAVRQSRIMDIFKNTRFGQSQETVIEAFERTISSTLKQFPILSLATTFDIRGTRICSIDLEEVAPTGTKNDKKQSAMMYMLAMHIFKHEWAMGDEILKAVPALYRDHYRAQVRTLGATPKTLFIDELHRTEGLAIRSQLIRMAHEGRKLGMKLILASQLIDHFDQDLIDVATAIWILESGSKEEGVEKISKKVGFSSSAAHSLRHKLTGPSERGTPLLLRLFTKSGNETHFLRFVVNPLELWALSTTPDDVVVRQMMYERFGPVKGRKILAQSYPKGTIVDELKRRKALAETHRGSSESFSAACVQDIANELILSNLPGSPRKL